MGMMSEFGGEIHPKLRHSHDCILRTNLPTEMTKCAPSWGRNRSGKSGNYMEGDDLGCIRTVLVRKKGQREYSLEKGKRHKIFCFVEEKPRFRF